MPHTFTTKELSERTWPDYVRFFSQGNGWDHCGCVAYQGFRPPRDVRKWADKRDWALGVKRDLVDRGCTHGILVYDDDEPVGWCQFGPAGELPVTDDCRGRALFAEGDERLWRATCFCTNPDLNRQGVAAAALRGALGAIHNYGGGVVEAYPMAHSNNDPNTDPRYVKIRAEQSELRRLVRLHGKDSPEVRAHKAKIEPMSELDYHGGTQLHVEGVGTVNATYFGRFHGGTVGMFQREGFTPAGIFPVSRRKKRSAPHPSRLVMRRTI